MSHTSYVVRGKALDEGWKGKEKCCLVLMAESSHTVKTAGAKTDLAGRRHRPGGAPVCL
jgi:hypothetical protein